MWHDLVMPRTTPRLDDDALRVARGYAARHGITLGQAISAPEASSGRLVGTVERNGSACSS
jgi:hypothetical protein